MSDKNLADMIGWVDISVADLQRAVGFYKEVLARDIEIHQMNGFSLRPVGL